MQINKEDLNGFFCFYTPKVGDIIKVSTRAGITTFLKKAKSHGYIARVEGYSRLRRKYYIKILEVIK